jgi:anti-anti-sigma factor
MSEFNISMVKDGDIAIFRITGYFNDLAGQEFKNQCQKVLDGGTILYVLNMKDTPVINSTGLSMLLDIVVNVIDYNDGKVALAGLSNLTRNALRMTGVLSLCQEFPTEAEAVASVK